MYKRQLLYENRDEDLKIASGETKQLQIKFSDSYREKIGDVYKRQC